MVLPGRADTCGRPLVAKMNRAHRVRGRFGAHEEVPTRFTMLDLACHGVVFVVWSIAVFLVATVPLVRRRDV